MELPRYKLQNKVARNLSSKSVSLHPQLLLKNKFLLILTNKNFMLFNKQILSCLINLNK